MADPTDSDILRAKLNQETAKADWKELQPFFARGQTVAVAGDLDLIEVAEAFADSFAQQQLVSAADIYPVFRELFQRRLVS